MLKSIAVAIGGHLLSLVLVLCTDPLLARLFSGDFAARVAPRPAARRNESFTPPDTSPSTSARYQLCQSSHAR